MPLPPLDSTPPQLCEELMAATADQMVQWLEDRELGWSLDHAGNLIEVRIWRWPYVIGRVRPNMVLPLADMLRCGILSIPIEILKTHATIKYNATDHIPIIL